MSNAPSCIVLVPTRSAIPDSAFMPLVTCILRGQNYWAKTYGTEAAGKFAVASLSRAHIDHARCQLAVVAMDGGWDWILWLDDDAVPPPDIIEQLIVHDKDMIVPSFAMRVPPGLNPNKRWIRNEKGEIEDCEYVDPFPPRLHRIDLTGFHTVLMKRHVLLKMAEQHGKEYLFQNVARVGEDSFFMAYASDLGLELWADTSIQVGHVGSSIIYPQPGLAEVQNAKNAAQKAQASPQP